MRILHIYKNYFPDTVGGVEQTIQTIVDVTKGKEVQHTILTLSDRPKVETFRGIEVIRLPETISVSSCPFSLQFLFEIRSIVDSYDLLHYHFPWPFAEALQVLLRLKKPYVVTYHSDIVKQKFLKPFYQPFLKRFLAGAKKIVVTSQNYLESSQDLKPYYSKCQVIPIGIPDLPKVDEKLLSSWRGRLGENFLLFIGVLRYYKGLDVLLKDLKRNKKTPLVLAGDGPRRAALEEQVQEASLGSVHFLGKVSEEDKFALLHLCRGLILPSNQRSEAFGIVLVEGLAAGKPLISVDIQTGTSFINQKGKTGWVVEPNSPEAFSKAIDAFFADDDLVKEMGRNSRQRYEALFTDKAMGEAYSEVYRKEKVTPA